MLVARPSVDDQRATETMAALAIDDVAGMDPV